MKSFLILFLLTFFQSSAFAQSVPLGNQSCPSFSMQEFDESGSKGIISFTVEFENGFDTSNFKL